MLMTKSKNYEGSISIISKIAQLIIARLDGNDISKKFKYYESLVRKGIGGFIVFGGKVKEVSIAIKRLQNIAEIPLFIASDLEQGLGQQLDGGTLFPPAMAVARAINPKNKNDIRLLRKSIGIVAKEAKAAGINLIFSPVLDVNTNPQNPIICTRAFSDNPRKVAWFGREFIKGFQRHGLIACVKHFPGHGDTTKDSHRELPVVNADVKRLHRVELYPFKQAVKAGVKMVMVGHLKVPAIDSKFASSLSKKIIRGLLNDRIRFKGLVITDAMNMHAVSKESVASGDPPRREGKACLMALDAGAHILLHPSKPEKIINYLSSRWDEIKPRVEESFQKVIRAKKELSKVYSSRLTVHSIGTNSSRDLAYKLTQKSISPARVKIPDKPVVLIIDDDNSKSGKFFIKEIRRHYPKIKSIYVDNSYRGSIKTFLNSVSNKTLIALVFSRVSAWKGRSGLSRKLENILKKAVETSRYSVMAGFCCPYALHGIKTDAVIEAYSGAELSEEAVAKILCNP